LPTVSVVSPKIFTMLLCHVSAGARRSILLSLPGDDVAREEVRRNFLEISTILIKQITFFSFSIRAQANAWLGAARLRT